MTKLTHLVFFIPACSRLSCVSLQTASDMQNQIKSRDVDSVDDGDDDGDVDGDGDDDTDDDEYPDASDDYRANLQRCSSCFRTLKLTLWRF